MEVKNLKLHHFRNFQQADLALQRGITLLYGANASGKTSLLESLFYLATSRSPRTTTDRELVRWGTPAESGAPPFARLQAEVVRAVVSTPTLIEVIIQWKQADTTHPDATPAPTTLDATTQKIIRINQKQARALDLIGLLRVVLFTPADLVLLEGPPGARRRYLDITLSQLNPGYVRTLSRYQTILQQRNSLLRAWREHRRPRRAIDSELGYWDNELAQSGAVVMVERMKAIIALNLHVGPRYQRMSGTTPPLVMTYQAGGRGEDPLPIPDDVSTLAQDITARLHSIRNEELTRGQTLIGPHRDDVRFTVGDINLGTYGSRGQQRSAALSLKLGEADFMQARSGERPVLLLDDVLSELDMPRRVQVLQAIAHSDQQTILTATDLANFDAAFIQQAYCLRVEDGYLYPKIP